MRFIADKFLSKRLGFRVRLFNVLAIGGILVSLVSAIASPLSGERPINAVVYLISCGLSVALLWYSSKSGKYQLCYLITIVVIFLIGFPAFFLISGAYYGALPYFFIFAIVFTVFMLEGKKAFAVAVIELVSYVGVCLYAYFFATPGEYYANNLYLMVNCVFGFVVVGAALGLTMSFHFRMYNQQQRELEDAREEAVRFSEAKGNFLANMSHEIRSPINVIMGMNEMILRESDSDQVRSYGHDVRNAGKALLLLINNILDLSKIESGKLEVVNESYRTVDLIGDLTLTGAELVGRYGLGFRAEADESLPQVLVGDFIHIKQVIVNFLSNAAKYTKRGGVVLSFGKKTGPGADSVILCISVADTGVGVREEDIPKLFDAFMRADMMSSRDIEGTGLGLAIAKELTGLMGGSIHVESALGEGSAFSTEIPQSVSDDASIGKTPVPEAKEETVRTGGFIAPGGRALVVDDNKENLQVIRSLLSRTMMRIDASSSGEDCLKAALGSRYDVILMDYMMPGMDGMETLLKLKAIPGFATPVIALTANVATGVREKLLAAGFAEYLPKPVMWDELEDVLISLLPPNLVIMSLTSSNGILADREKNDLAQDLSHYGVTLDDGLRYLSGDIVQYKKLAQIFVENFEPEIKEIRAFASLKDWGGAKYPLHSLKSKAKAMGAGGLSETAAKLECLCAEGSDAHVAVVLPVLYYEWELARDGLAAFIKRLDAILPEPEQLCATTTESSPSPGLPELLALLKHYRQPDALDVLERMIAAEGDIEIKGLLTEIRSKVDGAEFREAESMLMSFIGGSPDGE